VRFDIGILATQPVPHVVRQVQLAETLGYGTAWMTDTHLVCRELWVTLAACAVATSRIRLGPGVTVPHTRHVSVTASAIASLDELAPGRTVLGVGTGGSAAGTMGLRLEQVARVSTLESVVGNVRRLLARDTMRFESGAEGRLGWLASPCAVPIYVAGSGPRMLAAAGRLGDAALMYVGTSPRILRAGLQHVWAGAAQGGRQPHDVEVALWTPMSISADRALARDHVRGRVASAVRHPLPVELEPEDQAAVRRVREGYDSFAHATAGAAHRLLVSDRLVDLMALAGTPAEVLEQVQRIAREVPEVSRLVLLPQAPAEDFIQRESILRTFAEEVMARVA